MAAPTKKQPDADGAREWRAPAQLGQRYLTQVGNTTIYVCNTPVPDSLPLFDALVVPTGPDAGFRGAVAEAVRAADSQAFDALFKAVHDSARSRRDAVMEPEMPVLVEVDAPTPNPDFPRVLLAATGWESPKMPSIDAVVRASRAVIERAAGAGVQRLGLPLLGTGKQQLPPAEVMRAVLAAIQNALPQPHLTEVTVLTLEPEAFNEALALFSMIPQRFANDVVAGKDLLDVGSELQALTDVLLLRDMAPPLAVGILGGWGSGKSFAMHLMRRHIERVRSRPVDPATSWGGASPAAGPYVGHIYPIVFDAWTYAKSNLWASLMQAIFLELSRQVTLEQRIREQVDASKVTPAEAATLEVRLWLAFQDIGDADRKTLLAQADLAKAYKTISLPAQAGDTEAGKALWTALAVLKKEQQSTLDKKAERSAELNRQVEEKKSEIVRKVDKELRGRATEIALERAGAATKKSFEELARRLPIPMDDKIDAGSAGADQAGKKIASVQDALEQAQKDVAAIPMALRDYVELFRSNRVIGMAILLSALAPVVLGIAFTFLQEYLAAWMAGVGSVVSVAAALAKTARTWRDKIAATARAVAEERRQIEAGLEENRRNRIEVLVRENVRELEQERRALDSEIQHLRRQIGVTADYESMADLVNSRLKDAAYEGQLGLLHRVQRDLSELSDALTLGAEHPRFKDLRRHFPRGPARIVLFIDDLDRCPPDRVVEVLEATQLLVKTPLFVVVLALDARYVTRALERVYKDILTRRGNPSGLDYIEKIIQLPYSIRPVDRTNLSQYLHGQMVLKSGGTALGSASSGDGKTESQEHGRHHSQPHGAAAEPITAEVLLFSLEELNCVSRCCQQVSLTPRAIKRVVNAFKLLKIVWHRPNRHVRPRVEVIEAAVALLVLSARYPNAMRYIFEHVSDTLDLGGQVPLRHTMSAAAEGLTGKCAATEQAGVQRDLEIVSPDARLTSDLRPTFELVRSLSFVAEIGHDPDGDGPPWPSRRRRARRAAAEKKVQ